MATRCSDRARGDVVSVAGSLSAEIYQPPGRDARINIVLFADVVLACAASKQSCQSAGDQMLEPSKRRPRLSAELKQVLKNGKIPHQPRPHGMTAFRPGRGDDRPPRARGDLLLKILWVAR
jgi:hypothetical protein